MKNFETAITLIGIVLGVRFPGVICPGGQLSQEEIVRVQLSEGNFPSCKLSGGNCPRREFSVGNCWGGGVEGAIV